MRSRIALTLVWLTGLLLAILIVEAYFFRSTPEGIPWLLPADRPPAYKTLGLLYGGTIGSILVSWYTKPFAAPKRQIHATFIAGLAVALTVVFNLLLLYLLAQGHWVPGESLVDILNRARAVGIALAFLVMPVNACYFGIKTY